MSLNPETVKELVSLLAPFMSNEKDRSSLLQQAFGINAPVLRQIDCSGPTATFIPEMLHKFTSHSEVAPRKQALSALLEVIHEQVGNDIKERIDLLRPLIDYPANVASINQKQSEQIVEVDIILCLILSI